MRPEIEQEIRDAHREGLAWTQYRPFLDSEERVGAMRCGVISFDSDDKGCRAPSTHVSYCVGFKGRVASCPKHLPGKDS